MALYAYGLGVFILLLFWLLYRAWTGTWDLRKIYEGEDCRPSTSKLQFFLWTVVVIFSYVVISVARGWEFTSNIPPNLLIVMGLSVFTAVTAKGITVYYIYSGQAVKTKTECKKKKEPETNTEEPKGGVLEGDKGDPELSKIQMMAWTSIAIGIYLIRLVQAVSTPKPELPDIDAALMVLMGFGQGAYLGDKLITKDTPIITGLSKGSGKKDEDITIYGQSFGEQQSGSLITIDDFPINAVIPQNGWKDTQITFRIPKEYALQGEPWPKAKKTEIRVIVGGRKSNPWPFTMVTE